MTLTGTGGSPHGSPVQTDPSWSRGDWMQTYTGRRFYPLDPRPDEIDPADVAHALSLLCRYGGHVERFYSVAEHCVLVSQAVAPRHALAALLHDATEAYVVDVPRPLKRQLAGYREIEDRVWSAIALRFGVEEAMPWEVKHADNRILLTERDMLMPRHDAWSVDDLTLERRLKDRHAHADHCPSCRPVVAHRAAPKPCEGCDGRVCAGCLRHLCLVSAGRPGQHWRHTTRTGCR